MDTKTQAQKGFKTFMVTLVISLFVFSAIYVILSRSIDNTLINNQTSSVLGVQENIQKESVFGKIALSKPSDVQSRAVLAAGDVADSDGMASADDTPESTVPDTGLSGPTVGIILSSTIFVIVGYILLIGPRRSALSSFEKKVLKDLE